jgi:hypothetical protein
VLLKKQAFVSNAILSPPIVSAGTAERQRRRTVLAWVNERPLAATLVLALLGALLLQAWRPFFFLTCDTLSATLPVSTEAYRRLWEGRSPFYNPYLFGGFSLLGDLGHFTLWSPLALPFSWLARTRFYYLLPDMVGTLSLVVIAGSFCWSGLQLRRSLDLPISAALIAALSLSYAFTPYNFIVGASWIGFLNAQACYPLLLAGAFERDWRRALAMESAALLYAIFGGHMHLFTGLLICGGLLILTAAWIRRSAAPILVWLAAGISTLVLILPLLWPALAGFSQTTRSAGLAVAEASRNNVPWASLGASFLLGPMAQQLVAGIRIDLSDRSYNLAIAFALVNVPLVGLLAWKRRWNSLETSLLALGLLTALCIVRPKWLAEIVASLPLLKSLRWPFREIAVLQFLTHALFLVAYRPLKTRAVRMTWLAGGLAGAGFFALVFLSAAPTFCLFEPDRRLIISGEADRYWAELRASHGGGAAFPRFAVESDPRLLMTSRAEVPFALLGAFNYASLFRVPNIIGFSVTPPPNGLRLETELDVKHWFWGGIYTAEVVRRIVAAHPDVQPITLTGMHPATWSVFRGAAEESFRLDTVSGKISRLPLPPAASL